MLRCFGSSCFYGCWQMCEVVQCPGEKAVWCTTITDTLSPASPIFNVTDMCIRTPAERHVHKCMVCLPNAIYTCAWYACRMACAHMHQYSCGTPFEHVHQYTCRTPCAHGHRYTCRTPCAHVHRYTRRTHVHMCISTPAEWHVHRAAHGSLACEHKRLRMTQMQPPQFCLKNTKLSETKERCLPTARGRALELNGKK